MLDGCAFLPGDPRPKLLDWLRDPVERTPALREPLDLLMREIYADARST